MNNPRVASFTDHQRFALHEGGQTDSANLIIMTTATETAGEGLLGGVCLANPGKVPLEIIEVQSGSYLGEYDIVRFEDTYGRM